MVCSVNFRSKNLYIFPDKSALARQVALEWVKLTKNLGVSDKFSIALSGGSTPQKMFQEISKPKISGSIPWQSVHIFWCDERCVPPDNHESNYKNAWDKFLKYLPLPKENIHRIRGEETPEKEVVRYANEIQKFFKAFNQGKIEFNWVLLGMGADGHTASIFPEGRITSDPLNICGLTEHPQTSQRRITLTLDTINRARRISFLVTGKDKSKTLNKVLNGSEEGKHLPAAKINSEKLEWYVDHEAVNR